MKRFPTSSGKLYFGPMPSIEDLKHLRKMNTSIIWILASELASIGDIAKQYVPQILLGNIPDFDVPSDDGLFIWQANKLIKALKNGETVFLGCAGGRGRSGMGLAMIDILMNNKDADLALKLAKQYSGGPETIKQKEYIYRLGKLLKGHQFLEEFKKKD